LEGFFIVRIEADTTTVSEEPPEERLGRESASEGAGEEERGLIYGCYSDNDESRELYNPDPLDIIFTNVHYIYSAGLPSPILANNTENRQRDENLFLKQFQEAQTETNGTVETKIGNCMCKSAWCPLCHKLYYVPRYKDYVNKFDYKKTRHVILTVDRDNFHDELEALKTITGKKELSAFIRKLRNGKKVKQGKDWMYEHEPVKISRVLAVLEFHRDGFPHWHLLIEVEGTGKAGMIGGKNLRRAWKYGVVKETYFRNLDHWKNIAGYFADKGYFEKGKKYQSELPEFIKGNIAKRVRRITYYPGKRESGTDREIHPDVSEEEAYREVSAYFEKKAKENDKRKEPEHKERETNYKAILEGCGSKTFVRTVRGRKLLTMIVPVHFRSMKSLINPVYEEGKGYVCGLSPQAINLLELNAETVMISQEGYDQLFEDEETKEEPDSGGEMI
jgi:hypothetical protein